MVGLEALALQGLPTESLLLTRESEDQLADLAGNAMYAFPYHSYGENTWLILIPLQVLDGCWCSYYSSSHYLCRYSRGC
jgi:hypothetical protein